MVNRTVRSVILNRPPLTTNISSNWTIFAFINYSPHIFPTIETHLRPNKT
jgi:hypothetical protein